MSRDLNQCNFIGRLGADPEAKVLPSGTGVCNFRIACGWKTKDKEGTEWISIVAFGKLSEICGEYLKKGSKVFVSGSFRTRSWEKDGQKHYSTEIVADQMQMLDGRNDSGQQGGGQSRALSSYQPAPAPPAPSDDFDDDIPF